ncbi:MAG: hypothetical protein ACRCT8_04240 [Lacipirellulaceae bacterium]
MPRRQPKAPDPDRPAARRGRRTRQLLAAMGVLGLLALAAPTIVAKTPLRDVALARALPPEVGSLRARSGSFGWVGPTALDGVELLDPAGEVLFAADRVQVDQGVFALLTRGGPLALRVERPVVNVLLNPPTSGGSRAASNLEAFAERLAASKGAATTQPGTPAAPPTSSGVAQDLSVAIVGGSVRATDAITGERWLLDNVEGTLTNLGLGVDRVEGSLAGSVAPLAAQGAPAPPPAGQFQGTLGSGAEGTRTVRGRLAAAPLSLVAALIRRSDPGARLAGYASAEGEAVWRPNSAPTTGDPLTDLVARGFASTGRLAVASPEYLGSATGGKPLRLASAEAPWRLASRDGRLVIEQLEGVTEVGRARVIGSIDPREAAAWRAGGATPPSDLRVGLDLDVARLAAVAPDVLRLNEGVKLSEGRVRLDVTSKPVGSTPRVAAAARVESLAGVSRGQPIAWRDPIELKLVARGVPGATPAAPTGWGLESLECVSTFAKAQASGDVNKLSGSGELDLDRLSSDLRQFIDLGDWRLAGKGTGNFAVERAAAEWRATCDGALEGLFVGLASQPLVSEPKLDFRAEARGATGEPLDAAAGRVQVGAEGDTLLLAATPVPQKPRERTIDLKLAGDLGAWFRRARLVAPTLPSPDRLALRGEVEATAAGTVSPAGGALPQWSVVVTNLALDTPPTDATPLAVREPRVEASGDLAWQSVAGVPAGVVVRSDNLKVVSSGVSLAARNVVATPTGPDAGARGEVAYRADLARLSRWIAARRGAESYTAGGALSGSASIAQSNEGLRVTGNAVGERLALARTIPPSAEQPGGSTATVWAEPKIEATLDALVASGSGAIVLNDARIVSRSLNATAKGRIDSPATLEGVRLEALVEYDLEQLSPLLWPQLGSDVKLIGKDRAVVRVESVAAVPGQDVAPIRRLRARVEAPWQGASVFGLPIGPGRLGATLDNAIVVVDPLDVTVGAGRLTAKASAALDPPPTVLTLAPGPVLTRVAISPEVAERVLKFIAPVLADATRVDGQFSLALSEFTAPIVAIGRGRAAGLLTIHAAKVLPGPSIAELVATAKQVVSVARDGVQGATQPQDGALLTIENQQIEFQLADGRVFHRGLSFQIGDVTVQSSGSVGIDETLDLRLAIPILDEWVEKRPVLLGGLRGQSIRIPVRGTFARPEVDREVLRGLSQQLLQSAAEGALNQGLDKLFERLRTR